MLGNERKTRAPGRPALQLLQGGEPAPGTHIDPFRECLLPCVPHVQQANRRPEVAGVLRPPGTHCFRVFSCAK